jgi:DNA topoisomerase-1
VNLSNDAITELRQMIPQRFGAKALPDAPIVYQSKSKNAQEAHEAIRPSSALRTPEAVAPFLDADQARLYELIWKRTVASQMAPALLNTVSVELAAGKDNAFRVSGTTVVEPGFLAVYEEGKDARTEEDDEEGRRLPTMRQGERVPLDAVVAEQHFTEPPPRYSEASLVKALEEHGIGRPSTYASIIQTLLSREYVLLDARRFRPTDVGRVVAKFLSNHFTQYVDYDFTAKLEDDLDAVSRGEEDWIPLMRRFWVPFKALVADKMETVTTDEAKAARALGTDPVSGKTITVRLGRYGPFAQIGLKEDGDTPKYASLRPGQSLHTIKLAEAMELFKLPRTLGQDAAGEDVTVGVGRFGPFVKIGSSYASLKAEDDPYTIELPRALALVAEKAELAANRLIASFDDGAIQVLNGRYGPYITDGSKNARIPKDREPKSLSRDECAALLEAAPVKSGRGRFGRKGAAAGGKRGAPAKSAAAKSAPASKAAAAKSAAARAPARKVAAKKSAARKAPAKKSVAGKTAAKKAVAKRAGRSAVPA